MSKFFKKLLYFVLVMISFFGIILIIGLRKNQRLLANFEVHSDVHTIVIGDSHTKFAIDDKGYPFLLNASIKAEAYMQTYVKLKFILSHQSNIENVVLGFDHHNLSTLFDDFALGTYTAVNGGKYMPIMDMEDLVLWMSESRMRMLQKDVLMGLYEEEDKFMFIKVPDSLEDASKEKTLKEKDGIQKRVESLYGVRGEGEISEYQIKYLKKIIELCERKGVKLFFLKAPVYFDQELWVDKLYRNKYEELINQFNIECLDMNGVFLRKDCYMADGDHIHPNGIEQTTQYFIQILQKGLNDSTLVKADSTSVKSKYSW